MKLGYARVSTDEQHLDLQLEALSDCDLTFTEKQSGAIRDRPVLTEVIELLSEGDTLVVWRLDRLGRSLSHLIELVENFKAEKISLVSITENIDTTTPTGELIFHIFGAMAQFERQLTQQRCTAGIAAAKNRGVHCGRPLTPSGKIQAIAQLVSTGEAVAEACRKVGVDKSTYYRHKKRQSIATAVA